MAVHAVAGLAPPFSDFTSAYAKARLHISRLLSVKKPGRDHGGEKTVERWDLLGLVWVASWAHGDEVLSGVSQIDHPATGWMHPSKTSLKVLARVSFGTIIMLLF